MSFEDLDAPQRRKEELFELLTPEAQNAVSTIITTREEIVGSNIVEGIYNKLINNIELTKTVADFLGEKPEEIIADLEKQIAMYNS